MNDYEPYCPLQFIYDAVYTWAQNDLDDEGFWITVFSVKYTFHFEALPVHNTVTPMFIGLSQ